MADERRIAVVLDTTETARKLQLRGPSFEFLGRFASEYGRTLIIPQMVVEETVNHFRWHLTESLNTARKANRTLARLGCQGVPEINLDIDAEVARYETELKRRLSELTARVVPYDKVSLPQLVKRALDHRKPFDHNGRSGFRDAVIWESILQVLSDENAKVVLVSANESDFGKHGKLAQDLQRDLEEAGHSPDLVTVCAGLNKFVDEYITSEMQQLFELAGSIESNKSDVFSIPDFYSCMAEKLGDDMDGYVDAWDEYFEDALGCKLDEFYLGRLSSVPLCQRVNDVLRSGDDELTVRFTVEAPATLVFVPRVRHRRLKRWRDEDEGEYIAPLKFIFDFNVLVTESAKEWTYWESDETQIELMDGDVASLVFY